MTGKVINLRQARKTKAREDKRAAADANAARHGQTKSDRDARKGEKNRAQRLLDGHKVDDDNRD